MPYSDPIKQKEAQHSWYLSNKKTVLSKGYEYRKKRFEFLREAKAKPCADCKVEYPYYMMQFDHLPSHKKEGNVNWLIHHRGKKLLEEEIKKCEVVCANCHAKRSWERIQKYG